MTLFDYHDKDVVQQIVQAIKKDGVIVDMGYEAAAGNLNEMIAILNQTKDKVRKYIITYALIEILDGTHILIRQAHSASDIHPP